MTVDPEKLAAYADGELSELEATRVRRAIEGDPALARQLTELQALRQMLGARFDPVIAEPVPERLTRPIEQAAKVVDLDAARAARRGWLERPAARYAIGSAIAACLVLVLFVGRGGQPGTSGYADRQLAAALDRTMSGETAPDGTRMLLSFRDKWGEFCRAYAGVVSGGIACRDQSGWRLHITGDSDKTAPGEYRQAGSADAAIMAAAQDTAAGPALDRAAEDAARKAGWQPER